MSRNSLLLLAGLALTLASCAGTSPDYSAQIAARNLAISQETRGDYFIGRRFHIQRTQFWGYIRRPGQSWDHSKLVMVNEHRKYTPDRIEEAPDGSTSGHGYDHNYEYRMNGYFSGATIYDPNSDLFLPEFVLTDYKLISKTPGYLFNPAEKFTGRYLLRAEVGASPPRS